MLICQALIHVICGNEIHVRGLLRIWARLIFIFPNAMLYSNFEFFEKPPRSSKMIWTVKYKKMKSQVWRYSAEFTRWTVTSRTRQTATSIMPSWKGTSRANSPSNPDTELPWYYASQSITIAEIANSTWLLPRPWVHENAHVFSLYFFLFEKFNK